MKDTLVKLVNMYDVNSARAYETQFVYTFIIL
jgi:hypothetical protein